jgi:hypothetical protein
MTHPILMPDTDAHSFVAWLKLWMELARYQGRDVPDPEHGPSS